MNDLITVIVPVYNVEKYLDKCVESIVNQTYKNLEIILVDDGSPDNCPIICDKWAERDSRIKVIHKENGGVSSARNAGLDAAAGDYIGFVDSDDYCDLSMYECLYNTISENNADIVVCNNYNIDDFGKIIRTTEYKQAVYYKDSLLKEFVKENAFDSHSSCNKLFRKEIVSDIRFDIDLKVGEDYIFNYNAVKNSSCLVLEEAVLYIYVFHNSSVMRTINSDTINRWKNVKNILVTENNDDDIYNMCMLKYQRELLCCMKELIKSNNKSLISKHYPEIVDEIKNNSSVFLSLIDISPINKLFIKFINFSPALFKSIYSLYSKLNFIK